MSQRTDYAPSGTVTTQEEHDWRNRAHSAIYDMALYGPNGNHQKAFFYEEERDPRSIALKRHLNKVHPEPDTLTSPGPIHQAVDEYYYERSAQDVNVVLDTLDLHEVKPVQRELIGDSIELLFRSFCTGGVPRRMKMPRHYLAEHSIHTAYLMNRALRRIEEKEREPTGRPMLAEPVVDNTTQTILSLTSILHDILEDYWMKRPDHKPNTEQTVISGERWIFDSLATGAHDLDEMVHIAAAGVGLLTRRDHLDYDNGLGKLMDARAGTNIVPFAICAKLMDKESGVLTWYPFNAQGKLKTTGKAILTLDRARAYLGANSSVGGKIISGLSVNLAISLRRKLREEISLCQETYRIAFGEDKYEEVFGLIKEDLNTAIASGLLGQIDTPNTPVSEAQARFARSVYTTLVLGSHPERNYCHLSPLLKKEDEKLQSTRLRILAEQEQLKELLPTYNLSLGFDDALRSLRRSNTQEQQLINYTSRLICLERLATAYALKSDFALRRAE